MLTTLTLLLLLPSTIFVSATSNDALTPTATPSPESNRKETNDFDGCLCREYASSYATCYRPTTCIKFPKEFKTQLARFRLATTSIQNITVGDLDNLSNVKELELEANVELRWIQSGSFRGMSNLERLSISYDAKLHRLEEDTFEGLVNLRVLSIKRNGFERIEDFSSSLKSKLMPHLKRLELNELSCADIGEDDFTNLNGTGLEELYLVDSQVEYIHPQALVPLRNLKILHLGENLINATTLIDVIEALGRNGIHLDTLSLHGWGFKKYLPKDVMEVISKWGLSNLVLSKNQFDVISDDTFPAMPKLKSLDMSNVLLSNFTKGAFFHLPGLTELRLAENKFPSIPKGIFPSTLRVLDISKEARYFTLDNNTFENLTDLEQLDLSSNNIRKIPQDAFRGLINLDWLNLSNSTIFYIEAKSFGDLKRLRYLNLERNPLSNKTFVEEVFVGLENLEEINLGYCDISYLNPNLFWHLKSLKELDLSGNHLTMVHPELFTSIPKLENLNLQGNNLIPWDKTLKLNSLKTFKANDNKLTYFTVAMLQDFLNISNIDLSGNSFTCECDDFNPFSRFNSTTLSQIWSSLRTISNSKCTYPSRYSQMTLIDYFDKIYLSECSINLRDSISQYLIPICAFLIVSILASITLYIYRWHIRYWIFLSKMFLSKRTRFDGDLDDLKGHDNYLYDAFVSYSSEDRNFVVRLVAMLENYEPFLKLCVYERDFEVGTFISESVLECVARSRKTLLVISNSYVKSQWCRWEAQVAENHRLFFENERGECVNDSLVMIKLGTVSQHHLSPMLKYLMKTKIYLQWDADEAKQKAFWEKLRNALAPPHSSYRRKEEVVRTADTKD